jgi:hypothetical protein
LYPSVTSDENVEAEEEGGEKGMVAAEESKAEDICCLNALTESEELKSVEMLT